MAIVDQRPVKIDLSRCWLWREPLPSNDAEWSQIIMLIVAEITKFCFSGSTERLIEKWQALREQIDAWHRCRPNSFDPYYFVERSADIDRWFPEIWLSEQWHGTKFKTRKVKDLSLTVISSHGKHLLPDGQSPTFII